MKPLADLESLLLRMFSADELRRFVRYLPDGDELSAGLPGSNVSLAELVHAVVENLDRVGALDDAVVWAKWIEARPRREAEIAALRVSFMTKMGQRAPASPPLPQPEAPQPAAPQPEAPQPAAPQPAAPQPGVSQVGPDVLTILFASASPETEERLRFDRELREIEIKLRGALHGDRLRVVVLHAARYEDLRTALMRHSPHVLHLSCHGTKDGSLIFESSAGSDTDVVPKKKLLKLLKALTANLRLVVLNGCYSAVIAADIPPTIDMSIGMTDAIRDSEAVDFSVAFYEAIAFGKPVETAFEVALAGLDEGEEFPRLFPEGAQDAERRKRPLFP